MKILKAFPFVLIVLAMPAISYANYPMISPIPNVNIAMNSSTGVIRFRITDDITSPSNLVLSYKSNNTDLVPESNANIVLGGSGSDRTVKVTPVSGKWGVATITVIVTDTDGETNQEWFTIEVAHPPR